MSAGGLSYDCLTTRRKITLPSVEMWNMNMNILKDPTRSITTRKIDKVGDTQSILLSQEASGDRIAEMINVYARGVNPMVSVSYDNYGNNGGSKSSFAKNASVKLPYKFEVFRPPIIRQEQLMPLSRQPREWFYALTNPYVNDVISQKSCTELKKSIIPKKLQYNTTTNVEKPNIYLSENRTINSHLNHNQKNPQRSFQSDISNNNGKIDTAFVKPTKEIHDTTLMYNFMPNQNSLFKNQSIPSIAKQAIKENSMVIDQTTNVNSSLPLRTTVEPTHISSNYYQPNPLKTEWLQSQLVQPHRGSLADYSLPNQRAVKENSMIIDQTTNVNSSLPLRTTVEPTHISSNYYQPNPLKTEWLQSQPVQPHRSSLTDYSLPNQRAVKENSMIIDQTTNVNSSLPLRTTVEPTHMSSNYYQSNPLKTEWLQSQLVQPHRGTLADYSLPNQRAVKENSMIIDQTTNVNSSLPLQTTVEPTHMSSNYYQSNPLKAEWVQSQSVQPHRGTNNEPIHMSSNYYQNTPLKSEWIQSQPIQPHRGTFIDHSLPNQRAVRENPMIINQTPNFNSFLPLENKIEPNHISSNYYQSNPLKTEISIQPTNTQMQEIVMPTVFERNYDKKRNDIEYYTSLSLPNDKIMTNAAHMPMKTILQVPIQSHIGTTNHKIGLDKMIYDNTHIQNINDKNLNVAANTNLKYMEKMGHLGVKTENQRKMALIENTETITNKNAFGYDVYDIQSRNAQSKTNHELQIGSFESGGSYIPKFDRISSSLSYNQPIEHEYTQIKKKASNQYMERYNDPFH